LSSWGIASLPIPASRIGSMCISLSVMQSKFSSNRTPVSLCRARHVRLLTRCRTYPE
jgi:hypothetical protein